MIKIAGLLLGCVSLAALADPPAGQVDTSFGDVEVKGGVIVTLGLGESRAMAEVPGGDILLASLTSLPDQCLGLSRYSSEGLRTTAFSNQTNHVICHAQFLDEVVVGDYLANADLDMVVAEDGDIYVAGTVFRTIGGSAPFVCRFLADGEKQACVVIEPQDDGPTLILEPILAVSGQRLLVVSNSRNGMSPMIIRLALDSLAIEAQDPIIPALGDIFQVKAWDAELAPDGDIVIAGQARFETGTDFFVTRFDLTENQPVASFGNGGLKRLVFEGKANGFDGARALRVLNSGELLVAGRVEIALNKYAIGITRLDASGGMITSFNKGEPLVLLADVQSSLDAWSIDESATGKIVISGGEQEGATENSFAMRLLPDGAVDPEFDVNGFVAFDFSPGFEGTYGMVLQGERIVLGGSIEQGGELAPLLFRLSDGRLFNDGFESSPP